MKSYIFMDITPCSPSKVIRRFGEARCFHLWGWRIRQASSQHEASNMKIFACMFYTCFTVVSCLTYSSTLKIEATCSSETSVDFQLTTRCYIPEDRTLQRWILLSKLFFCSEYSNAMVFNIFCSRTPRYNFSSTLYPQSCWCIIYIQNKLNKLHPK
jgi:hypothetical protein